MQSLLLDGCVREAKNRCIGHGWTDLGAVRLHLTASGLEITGGVWSGDAGPRVIDAQTVCASRFRVEGHAWSVLLELAARTCWPLEIHGTETGEAAGHAGALPSSIASARGWEQQLRDQFGLGPSGRRRGGRRGRRRAGGAEADPAGGMGEALAPRALPLKDFVYSAEAAPRLLTLGDGDFSFSLALLHRRGAAAAAGSILVATAYDSEESVLQKYDGAAETLRDLRAGGALLLFSIDATSPADLDRVRAAAAAAAAAAGVCERSRAPALTV